jgi:hypothetical protein
MALVVMHGLMVRLRGVVLPFSAKTAIAVDFASTADDHVLGQPSPSAGRGPGTGDLLWLIPNYATVWGLVVAQFD